MMKDRNKGRILVVDSEPEVVEILTAALFEEGYSVIPSNDAEHAGRIIEDRQIDAAITDLKLSGTDGVQLFDYIAVNRPEIPVIILTSDNSLESAISAMARGAFYCFAKPPDFAKLRTVLSEAVEHYRFKRESDLLKNSETKQLPRYRLVGNTPEILRTIETIEAVKDSASSVLISGETGTGKELIARTLHYSSPRRGTPFITVNCGAIPKELIEAELFGCEKGAYGGAITRRVGKFEEAGSGAVFLDGIGELDLPVQAKLLQVIQDKEIERLGGTRKIRVGFRVLSATKGDLADQVKKGRFRHDLYYRINVIEIKVPPLRERKEDIPMLTKAFLSEFCERENKVVEFSNGALTAFMDYHWPGNVRQLRNVVERAVVLARGNRITEQELPSEITTPKQKNCPNTMRTLKELEFLTIKETLRKCKGNKSKTAKLLGISRKAFYKRLREGQIL